MWKKRPPSPGSAVRVQGLEGRVWAGLQLDSPPQLCNCTRCPESGGSHPPQPQVVSSLCLLMPSARFLTIVPPLPTPSHDLQFSSSGTDLGLAWYPLCYYLFLSGANFTYAAASLLTPLWFPVNLCFQLARLGH